MVRCSPAYMISIHALREEGDTRRIQWPAGLYISIHALREEGDGCNPCIDSPRLNFNPRPPRGGRPVSAMRTGLYRPISIHALREEGDGA